MRFLFRLGCLVVIAVIAVVAVTAVLKIDVGAVLSSWANRQLGVTTNVKVMTGEAIITAVKSQAKLTTLEADEMVGVEAWRDYGGLNQRVGWTGNICVRLSAGIDLHKLDVKSSAIAVEKPGGGYAVIITLPPAEIFSTEVQNTTNDPTKAEQQGLELNASCYTEATLTGAGIGLPGDVGSENFAMAQDQAKVGAKEQAVKHGLLDVVRINAQNELRKFIFQLVPPNTEIEFR